MSPSLEDTEGDKGEQRKTAAGRRRSSEAPSVHQHEQQTRSSQICRREHRIGQQLQLNYTAEFQCKWRQVESCLKDNKRSYAQVIGSLVITNVEFTDFKSAPDEFHFLKENKPLGFTSLQLQYSRSHLGHESRRALTQFASAATVRHMHWEEETEETVDGEGDLYGRHVADVVRLRMCAHEGLNGSEQTWRRH
ncbi:hypothetical protein F2P81_005065 [Scophthalmus maximus]|uniref:Uncharacterized protein n=1 Tax=Scophthalmus maximus TaxID=52904 RepID=A0A6A4TGZ8_SCOMX|nr:hypothetical protein F2P81_005065 [Scophthalmus maximus]